MLLKEVKPYLYRVRNSIGKLHSICTCYFYVVIQRHYYSLLHPEATMKATQEFETLSIDEKARMVFEKGMFVSKSEYHQLDISLYRLGSEFVELWYNPVVDRITRIEELKNKAINPYLKHLDNISLN